MPRMIELIRQSAVPANIMRSAAHGALSVPAPEMLEILVYLSSHPMFGEQARLTLARWDEASAHAVAADSTTSPDVLAYMASPQNFRPNLLPVLLENPSLPETCIADLMAQLPQSQIAVALSSGRIRNSKQALRALVTNCHVGEQESRELQRLLASDNSGDNQDPIDIDVSGYLRDHAEEVKEAETQPFQLLGSTADEEAEVAAVTATAAETSAAAAVRQMKKAPAPERESVVQKIARLSVGERVLLAMKGNKDERFILIRDGARIVSNAVLESPKLTDSEVETFAGMKNVSESVLRGITMKRKFMKNYNVIRMLTMNPRCPIDVSAPLLSHLLTIDLKNLSINKNVADTVRKMAYKLCRDRLRNQ